jgi:acyl-CoA thioester hydrolase
MHTATTEIPVRYAETDQMGVVYHANYLVWMELGRTALIKSLGCDYLAMEEAGVVSPVLEARVKYRKPLRYGETAMVKTWIEEYDGLRVTYGYEIYNPRGELCATASTLHVCVEKKTFRPVVMKRRFPEWHRIYEEASRS